jgi:hypothetical protein
MAPRKRGSTIVATFTFCKNPCGYLVDAYEKDQFGVSRHLRAYCALESGHENEHALGPWFNMANHPTVTVSKVTPNQGDPT